MRMTTRQYLDWLARQQPAQPPPEPSAGSEAGLHAQIADVCRRRGWIALHARMDRPTTINVGAPDFIVLGQNRDGLFQVWLVECKSRRGKLSPAQRAFAAWVAKLGGRVHTIRTLAEFDRLTSS